MIKRKTGGHPDLKMANPNAAAIDIGSTMHMAAVNPDTDIMPVPVIPSESTQPRRLSGSVQHAGQAFLGSGCRIIFTATKRAGPLCVVPR